MDEIIYSTIGTIYAMNYDYSCHQKQCKLCMNSRLFYKMKHEFYLFST